MEITKQQFKSILEKAPAGTNAKSLAEGLIMRGYNLEGLDPVTTSVFREESKQAGIVAGNQFQEQPKSLWDKAKSLAATIVGGGELARGAGLAISAPSVLNSLGEAQTSLLTAQSDLISKMKEQAANGEDTTKTKELLKLNQLEIERIADANGDFAENLPSAKQVIGSGARLAGTAIGGAIAKGASKLFGVGKATTVAGGVTRGLGAGVAGGAVEGAIQGAGYAAEEDRSGRDILESGAIGAGIGGAAGGLIGTIAGGITGRFAPKSFQQKLGFITPDASDLTPTQYEEFLTRGRIEPRTATSPAKFVFSADEAQTAKKFSDLIENDPAKTAINFANKVSDLDEEVGTFLSQNNSIFNKGELRNQLQQSMDDIVDITVPEERLARAKEQIIDAFVNKLEKNDMVSLWQARKAFDREIQGAFSGSPSLQKDVKRALRNSVQRFIGEKTPDTQYQDYMDDMSGILDLNEFITQKAAKQRTRSAIMQWIKENPKKAKAVGWGSGLFIANQVFNPLSGGGAGE